MRKLRVGILFGGRSGEHEVSLLSAASVLRHIDRERYEPVEIGITKEGRWLIGPGTLQALQQALPPATGRAGVLPDPSVKGVVRLAPGQDGPPAAPAGGGIACEPIDVYFPLLHGPLGEDGTVQGLLELAGAPYVGCGVAASAVGMDKELMKAVFRAEGLPLLDYLALREADWRRDPGQTLARVEAVLGYPCFVKPANLGSSVGISRVDEPGALAGAVETALGFDRKVVVERAAQDCREIECSVLGNDDLQVSVPGEIIPAASFYDYRSKYLDEGTRLVVPAPLDGEVTARVQALALRAFRAIDGAGLARVDFFVHRQTGKVWVNEINTIPGFTSVSMYPRLWQASGLSYPELIDRLIQLAWERHEQKARRSGGLPAEGLPNSTAN